MPALTAAGPSPTAPISGPTCRRTLTPRNTSASAAPRPSPACHSWRGTRNLAAAALAPERHGFGAGRRARTSPRESMASTPLGRPVLPHVPRGARHPGRAGAQPPTLRRVLRPTAACFHPLRTRAAQLADRVSRGSCTSPAPLCPLRRHFSPRDNLHRNKNHHFIFRFYFPKT